MLPENMDRPLITSRERVCLKSESERLCSCANDSSINTNSEALVSSSVWEWMVWCYQTECMKWVSDSLPIRFPQLHYSPKTLKLKIQITKLQQKLVLRQDAWSVVLVWRKIDRSHQRRRHDRNKKEIQKRRGKDWSSCCACCRLGGWVYIPSRAVVECITFFGTKGKMFIFHLRLFCGGGAGQQVAAGGEINGCLPSEDIWCVFVDGDDWSMVWVGAVKWVNLRPALIWQWAQRLWSNLCTFQTCTV